VPRMTDMPFPPSACWVHPGTNGARDQPWRAGRDRPGPRMAKSHAEVACHLRTPRCKELTRLPANAGGASSHSHFSARQRPNHSYRARSIRQYIRNRTRTTCQHGDGVHLGRATAASLKGRYSASAYLFFRLRLMVLQSFSRRPTPGLLWASSSQYIRALVGGRSCGIDWLRCRSQKTT
jgi:hypothetical protein